MPDDIAIAHKDLDVYGGGEVLAEELAQTFGAPLYVGHKNTEDVPSEADVDVREIAPDSRWHHLMRRGGALRGIGHMMHWRDNADQHLHEYETVITSGNEPLWWTSRDYQTVVAYTHSTPRWMYDLYHDVDGFLQRTYNQIQRRVYEGPAKDPDLFVANSDAVARRIEKYWNIPEDQIRVVYPPVQTHEYSLQDAETRDFYFHLGRLAEHKRIDDLIRAFNDLGTDYHLKIAGKGPDRSRLESMAGSNVEFLGYVSEDRKHELMSAAKAHVYPALNEDFGMVPVESMAAGTPVIGVNEGFTRFQLVDGKNGYTFDRERDGHLRETVRYFDRQGVDWSGERIAEFASRFSVDQFQKGMQTAVEEARERTRITPDWQSSSDSGLDATEDASRRPVRADGGDA